MGYYRPEPRTMTSPRAAIAGALLTALPALAQQGVETPQAPAASRAALIVAAAPARRAQELDRLGDDGPAVGQALIALGDQARGDAQFPRAVAAYEAAATLGRRLNLDAVLGPALTGGADAWFRQGALDKAEALATEAGALYERAGDGAGTAAAWNVVGNVRWTQGRMQDALALYQKTLTLWRAAGDKVGVARALNNLGQVERNTGATDEALAHFQEARAIFEELGDVRRASVVIDNIGIVYYWRGEYAEALDYARRAMDIREVAQDKYGLGKSWDSLGNLYEAQGDYARALDAFQRALALRTETGDKHGLVETSHNLGLVYLAQGDYAPAIAAFKRGLRLNAGLGDASFETEALLNIGAAAWRMGDRARAGANLRRGLAIAEKHHLRFSIGEILHNLGDMAAADGRPREAEALLRRSLAVREEVKDQSGIAGTLTSLASVRLSARRYAEAARLAADAAERARTYEQPEHFWEAQTVLGAAQRRLGLTGDARRSLTDAVAVVEGLRGQVVGAGTGRERVLDRRLSPYHELMTLEAESGSPRPALEMAERSKARVLAGLMRRGEAGLARAMTAAEKADERRQRAALRSLNERLQAEEAKEAPDEAALRALRAERREKRAAYESFQDAASAAHPELRLRRGEAAPFAFDDARALLPDASTALLEYAVTRSRTYVFVLTLDGGRPHLASHVVPLGADALAPLVARFRDRIASRALGFTQDGRRLFDLLLGPAAKELAGRTRLVIAPDAALWNLPFQALQDASGRYLIESASVTYVPSLTVLREILRRPARATAPTLLAMGKGDFAADPLPQAEGQVRALAALYGPDRAITYVGDDAREDRFKAEAPRHSILHLATHGVLDESSPLYSHVVLSPGGAPAREDGLLEAWEMLELPLDADLVVLSACDTGRGRIAPGEGIVGTMWALFVAGARGMVVSQWKVEAAATTELMTGLHQRLARGGGARSEHLRQAALALLRSRRHAHPFYWAGFVLVGSPS